MGNPRKVALILVSLFLLLVVIFPSEARVSTNNVAFNSIPPKVQQITPLAYCETPQLLTTGYAPQIDNRTVVYRTISGSTTRIQVYDLGQDSKKSGDDRGIVNIIPQSNGIGHDSFSIYKGVITYLSYDISSFSKKAEIISAGNDNVFGTSDDIGPSQIFTTPNVATYIIRKLSMDKNSVSFEVASTNTNLSTYYYCNSDSQGSCWSHNPSQINLLNNNLKDNFLSTSDFNNAPYFLWDEADNTGNKDIYFKDNAQEGVFYNDSESESLQDVSDLFLVYSQKVNTVPRYSSIGVGLVNAPGVKVQISRPGNYTDSDARISHSPGKNGEIFVSWIRTYPNQQKKYFVSNINSRVEIQVPFNPTSSVFSTPYIDDNTLVFGNGANIFTTECYYSP